jgi:hypothetical protein
MLRLRPIILLLALALFIQNTCPHGFAGKTTLARTCDRCTLKQQHAPLPDQQNRIAASQTPVHYPLFLFSVPPSVHVLQPGSAIAHEPVVADRYTDATPAEFLRPPRA